jgi:hypothetical protein
VLRSSPSSVPAHTFSASAEWAARLKAPPAWNKAAASTSSHSWPSSVLRSSPPPVASQP